MALKFTIADVLLDHRSSWVPWLTPVTLLLVSLVFLVPSEAQVSALHASGLTCAMCVCSWKRHIGHSLTGKPVVWS